MIFNTSLTRAWKFLRPEPTGVGVQLDTWIREGKPIALTDLIRYFEAVQRQQGVPRRRLTDELASGQATGKAILYQRFAGAFRDTWESVRQDPPQENILGEREAIKDHLVKVWEEYFSPEEVRRLHAALGGLSHAMNRLAQASSAVDSAVGRYVAEAGVAVTQELLTQPFAREPYDLMAYIATCHIRSLGPIFTALGFEGRRDREDWYCIQRSSDERLHMFFAPKGLLGHPLRQIRPRKFGGQRWSTRYGCPALEKAPGSPGDVDMVHGLIQRARSVAERKLLEKYGAAPQLV